MRPVPAARPRALRHGLALALPVLLAGTGIARAQDEGDVIDVIGQFIASLTDRTRDTVFDFLETVELWDAETEIDRLVGNPWELHDSTEYKLALLPLHIRFPIYQQLARQMTRHDELRSRRIQNVGPDSVSLIAVRLDSLARDLDRPDGAEILGPLSRHFSVREVLDLSVFGVAHQPFFPSDEAGWASTKRRLARSKFALAGGALGVGALFNAGAFARSGTIVRSAARDARLGWYGGVRQVGFAFQPLARGGLTAQFPGLEMAAGVAERINPDASDRRRAIELALREGWLRGLTSPSGWDAFFEGALRAVTTAGSRYDGERTTGRAGLFAKRENPARLPNVVFRSSAEVESDFVDDLRFAVGIGLEHTRTGLATVLQSSRTAIIRRGERTAETRGGLFLAGTIEPPTAFLVDLMNARGRQVRDEWEAVRRLGAETAERERHMAALSLHLAEYLESRRVVYSVMRWPRSKDDLHGPLDGKVLTEVRDALLVRLYTVAGFLEEAPRALSPLHGRFLRLREHAERLSHDRAASAALYDAELAEIDRAWQRASARVRTGLRVYEHYRAVARRIAAAARALSPARDSDPLRRRTMERLAVLTAVQAE